MIPLEIKDGVTNLKHDYLAHRLEYLAYQFCVNADFTKTVPIEKLTEKLEMCVLESLLRVCEVELGYRPYQNKLYERVEYIFDDQTAYNINRMISTLRRARVVPLDPSNTKYIEWMKNRVRYGVKALCHRLIQMKESNYT